MKNKHRILIVFDLLSVLILISPSARGQNRNQLIQQWRNSSVKDTAYVHLSNIIADSLLEVNKIDSAENYLEIALETSRSIGYLKGEALSTYLLGRASIAKSKDAQGMEWITQARALFDSLNDKKGIADCIMQAGVVAYGQKDYSKAYSYFHDAEAMYSSMKIVDGTAKSLYLGGLSLTELGEYDLAEEKLLASVKLAREVNDIWRVNECYWGLGELYLKMNQYSKSEEYYQKCLKFFISKDNHEGIALATLGIGLVDLKTGNEESAKRYLLKAFNESKDAGFYPVLMRSSYSLSSIYLKEKNYPDALKFQTDYYASRDSVYSIDKTRKIAELQYDLDIAKKQAEIDLQKERIKNDGTIRSLLIGGIILLLILVIMAYQRYRFKQKTNRQLEETNSDLQRALKDLKSAQTQLVQTEKMASLGHLTAGIAHEINNPINFVSASINPLKRNFDDVKKLLESYDRLLSESDKKDSASLLRKDSDMEQNISESENLLQGIEEGSRRTAEIVKGLRNFSRLDTEEMKKVNINEGIQSTLTLLQNKMNQQNIGLTKSFGDIPRINGYPGQLNQVFMNVLTNAIDAIGAYNPQKAEERKIVITTSEENNFVKISFRDTGCGMIEEVKQKIFDPFFTTKEVGKGTGLGLSISYGIIEKHNGKIEVYSQPDNGTEFIISLPIAS